MKRALYMTTNGRRAGQVYKQILGIIAELVPSGVIEVTYPEIQEVKRELEAAKLRIVSARETIQYYADPANWSDRTSGHGESSRDVIKDDGGYEHCAGKRARKWYEENK